MPRPGRIFGAVFTLSVCQTSHNGTTQSLTCWKQALRRSAFWRASARASAYCADTASPVSTHDTGAAPFSALRVRGEFVVRPNPAKPREWSNAAPYA